MSTTKMVVFDMAGTTVNENNVVYKTLQKSLAEAGFAFTLSQVLEQGAGSEKRQAIKKVLKAYADIEDEALTNSIYADFIIQLAAAYQVLNVLPQDNAVALFATLKQKNILTVLNTGYNRETAQALLDRLGWEKGREFDLLVTATDVSKSRPNPDMILFAMQEFGLTDAGSVIKVGDSIIDIEEGKNAGCAVNVGITTGAHTYAQLHSAKPEYIITNLLELVPILEAV